MLSFLVSFFISFVICFFIIRYKHLHSYITSDPVKVGPQKFHHRPTPRIGGLAILGGIIGGSTIFVLQKKEFSLLSINLLLCCLPVFAGGLLEDVTKKISPKIRLIFCFTSAVLAFYLLDAKIIKLDIPLLDSLVKLVSISLIITMIAIAGLSNAINIIDGFNGLASGVSIIIFTGLSYVAFKVNDLFLLFTCIVIISAIVGFFIWNYPRGYIFLGDGGAYLLGFLIATVSVLLVKRNSQVSPWFPLLLSVYPVWETLFSIYRKNFLRKLDPFLPDGLHFHMLVYKRLVRWAFGQKDTKYLIRRNSATSVYLWGLTFISFIPAVLFWQKTLILQLCTFVWIFIYIWLYHKIIRFKAPKWLSRK